jgi:hypothetical protein
LGYRDFRHWRRSKSGRQHPPLSIYSLTKGSSLAFPGERVLFLLERHKSLTIIVHFVPILVSARDPASFVHHKGTSYFLIRRLIRK